jgi:hypothetical protein
MYTKVWSDLGIDGKVRKPEVLPGVVQLSTRATLPSCFCFHYFEDYSERG